MATSARAQQDDPIGALLDPPKPAAPSSAPSDPPPRPLDSPPLAPPSTDGIPSAPLPYTPTRPVGHSYIPPGYTPPTTPGATASAPLHIEDVGKSPDGPLSATDLNLEARMRASFAAAQGMQGPLDGPWTLRGSSREQLYAFQLVDKNQGLLEGAWRDPRRPGAPDASGFIDQIQKIGSDLTLRIQIRPSDAPILITLHPQGSGWTGDLRAGEARQAVTLGRF